MKVLFIPFSETWQNEEQKALVINSASSRWRCEYVAKYIPFAEIYKRDVTKLPGDFDVVVFQKAYTQEMVVIAKFLKLQGKKIVFDLCDADWVKPEAFLPISEMAKLADHLVASTFYIQEYLIKIYRKPTTLIVDRIDLEKYPDSQVKCHAQTENQRIVWVGNRNTIKYLNLFNEVLYQTCSEHPFTLRLISDQFNEYQCPDSMKVVTEEIKWNLDTVDGYIRDCDIMINPHDLNEEVGKAKSDNKTILAWSLGLPVVSHGNDKRIKSLLLAYLKSAEKRNKAGLLGRKFVKELYDSKISATEYRLIFNNL